MTSHSTLFHLSCFLRKPQTSSQIPARDRVIDFGKHKGKMLGTLPSSYLKWVSANLRARDFHHWAHLADQVLNDAVYKDRIEWESAENALTGDRGNAGGVSELLSMSESFGWDNDDKAAWSKVNFELLGTSKGGRIPRRNRSSESEKERERESEVRERRRLEEGESLGEKRRERKERRMRMRMMKKDDEETLGNVEKAIGSSFGNGKEIDDGGLEDTSWSTAVENSKRFPGRESLLKKAYDRRKYL